MTENPVWLLLAPGLPLLGAVLLPLTPGGRGSPHPWALARLVCTGAFLSSLLLAALRPAARAAFLEIEAPWFTLARLEHLELQARFHLGADGISLLPVVLAAFLGLLVSFAARPHVPHLERRFLFGALLLQASVTAAWLALDLLLFVAAFEASLVAAFFLSAVGTGEKPAGPGAALPFLLQTLAGGALLLVGAVVLVGTPLLLPGAAERTLSTSILEQTLLRLDRPSPTSQALLLAAFGLAGASVLALPPFHAAAVRLFSRAGPPAALLLAGMLLPLGLCVWLRLCLPAFPQAAAALAPWGAGAAALGGCYAALRALLHSGAAEALAFAAVAQTALLGACALAGGLRALEGAVLLLAVHAVALPALWFLLAPPGPGAEPSGEAAPRGPRRRPLLPVVLLAASALALARAPGLAGWPAAWRAFHGIREVSTAAGHLAAAALALAAVWPLLLMARIPARWAASPSGGAPAPQRSSAAVLLAAGLLALLLAGLRPDALLSWLRPALEEAARGVEALR